MGRHDEPPRVLIVGLDADLRARVEQALEVPGLHPFLSRSVADVRAALALPPDDAAAVALVRLAPTGGPAPIEELQRAVPELPVVAVLPAHDEAAARAAVVAGAVDFVTEDHLDDEVLLRTLRFAIERRRLEGEVARRSMIDETTGVYNATGFEQVGSHHLGLSARTNEPVALVLVRLDLGPGADAGAHDTLMADAAAVLRTAVRDSDVIGRLGPDTFGVVLAGNAVGAEAAVLARIVEAVATHNARAGRTAPLALSLGSAVHDPERPSSLADLIREAQDRMEHGSAGP